MKFAREGWSFVLPIVAVATAFALLGWFVWAIVAAVVAFSVLLFFRDPKRNSDAEPKAVLAAADGLITKIDEIEDPQVGPGRFHRIVTFLSVFDVHVQKAPIAGHVVLSQITGGRKVAAFREDADQVNEHHLSVFRPLDADNERIGVRQIAGLLARRVVCYLEAGETVTRAQPMGVIKFGSRVDLILPLEYEISVARGDRVKNGETIMAVRSSSSGIRGDAKTSETAS